MAAPAPAHEGQDGLHHRHRAEHVHVELAPHLRQRRFFHDAFVPVARVVDQDIDGADAGLDVRHHAVDGVEVGHVQHAANGGARRQGFECDPGRVAAHRADDAVAVGQGFFGERAAEAAADASDEQSLGGCHEATLHCQGKSAW
ncbi:hypothetical protein D3C72_1544430 [compost metagenome]